MKLPIPLDLFQRFNRLSAQAALVVYDRRIIGHSGDSVEILPARRAFLLGMLRRVLRQVAEFLVDLSYPISSLSPIVSISWLNNYIVERVTYNTILIVNIQDITVCDSAFILEPAAVQLNERIVTLFYTDFFQSLQVSQFLSFQTLSLFGRRALRLGSLRLQVIQLQPPAFDLARELA